MHTSLIRVNCIWFLFNWPIFFRDHSSLGRVLKVSQEPFGIADVRFLQPDRLPVMRPSNSQNNEGTSYYGLKWHQENELPCKGTCCLYRILKMYDNDYSLFSTLSASAAGVHSGQVQCSHVLDVCCLRQNVVSFIKKWQTCAHDFFVNWVLWIEQSVTIIVSCVW